MAISRQLVVRRGGATVLTYTVKRGPCTIGRSPESDLVLPDPAVSPHHAEMRVEATSAAGVLQQGAVPIEVSAAVLTDLGSDGGTFVGGVRLLPQQPRAMAHGDVITIGPYELVFRAQGADAIDDLLAGVSAPAPDSAARVAFQSDATVDGDDADAGEDEPGMPMRAVAEVFGDMLQFAPDAPDAGPRPTSRYMRYLPAIFHDDDFLARFLQLFEGVWEPLEQRQDHIDVYFDAATCPAEWLPWMASWFGIVLENHWPEARKRALLARVIDVYRWRGTAYGLERVIEACLGARPEITVTVDNPHVFRVTVRPPSGADAHFERDLNELIAVHKPAHTGYRLEILR
jgi:phage tail-like protein